MNEYFIAWRCSIAAAAAVLSVGATLTPLRAQDFYRGKTISIIVSGGGTFDSYARLLAKYMPAHIPGNPTMVVKAMTGAAGLKATNYIYNVAPKDGTEIAGVHGQIPSQPLFSSEGVQYDPNKLSWIGNVTSGLYVGYMWRTAPVQSMEDLLTKEAIVGGQSLGALPIDISIIANRMAGTKLRIVTGYAGAAEAKLAVMRGELHGEFGTLLAAINLTHPDWIREKKIKLIVQLGPEKHASLPDVPLLSDFVKNAEDRAALDLYLSRQKTDKPYLAPPGVPRDRLAILRRAFDAAVKDPGFLAEAERMGLEVNSPMTGEALAELVAATNKSSPALARRINDILASFSAR
jgi:tripartite-type tricarboxylate transporter receptor subunit TctC